MAYTKYMHGVCHAYTRSSLAARINQIFVCNVAMGSSSLMGLLQPPDPEGRTMGFVQRPGSTASSGPAGAGRPTQPEIASSCYD